MEKILLEKLEDNDICHIGQIIINNYSEMDILFIRTVKCINSYIEVKTEKGQKQFNKLKKQFNL